MTADYEDFQRCDLCGAGLEPETAGAVCDDPDVPEPGDVMMVMVGPNLDCPGSRSAETAAGVYRS